MRILRNLFLALVFVVILAVLAVGAGVWWVNRYVHSPEFAAEVKGQAGRLAGVPVDFKSINWDMSQGLTIDELTVRNDVANEQSGILQAKQIKLKYDWKALLNRHFDITEFDIIEPAILIGQQPNGGYRLPIVVSNPSATAAKKAEAAQPAPSGQPGIVLVVQKVVIEKGHLEIKNADGSYNLLCSDINGTANNTNPSSESLSLDGSLNIGEAQFMGKVKITSIRSPFTYKSGVLNFSALEATAYKGKVNGTWESNLFDPKISYNLKLDLQGCDVNDLLGSAFQKPGVVSGKLDAKTLWLGNASEPMGVSGKGSLDVQNGQVINLPAFKNLAQMLGGMNALAQPDFSECKMEYTVGDQVLTVQTLSLKSALFDLSGNGKIKFDSTVDMPMQAGLNPEITKQVPPLISGLLAQRPDGYKIVPFNVTGTVEQPKVDIAMKQGDLVNGVAGLLQQAGGKDGAQGLLQQVTGAQQQQPANGAAQPNNNGGNNTVKQAEGMLQGLFKKNEPQQPATPAPAAAQQTQQPQAQPQPPVQQ